MENMDDIPFYRFVQGIIWTISHFFDGEYGRYPILSICPGDSMDDILFYRWGIWAISYFIHGEYGRYPILSICPGDSMDKIRRISKITKISKISKERYFIFSVSFLKKRFKKNKFSLRKTEQY